MVPNKLHEISINQSTRDFILYAILFRFTCDAVKLFFACLFEGLHEFNTPENYAILQM